MTDLTTTLKIDLQSSQFNRELRGSGRVVERFASSTEKSLKKADRSITSFARRTKKELSEINKLTGGAFTNIRNEVVAIGTAWAGMKMIKDSAHLDKSLLRLSQTAGVVKSKTKELRQELFQLQTDHGTQVEQMLGGYEKLIQMGLSWQEALGSGRSVSAASAITGANPQVVASGLGVAASTYGFDLSNKQTARLLTDQFLKATDFGSVEFENLADTFGALGVNAKDANLSITQTLALIESLSAAETNPQKLSTLIGSGLRIFTEGEYRKNVKRTAGIDFFDKRGEARDPIQVLKDISKKYKEYGTTEKRQAEFVSIVFKGMDQDTQKFMRSVLGGDYLDKTSKFNQELKSAAGEVERRLNGALGNAIDQTSRLKGALRGAVDGFIQPLNSGVEKVIKMALDSKKEGGLGLTGDDLLLGGLGALGAGVAGYKYGGPVMRKVLGKGGQLAGGIATGKAIEAAAGVTPVFVVNMPKTGGEPTTGSFIDDLFDIGDGKRKRKPRIKGPKGLRLLSQGSFMDEFSKLGVRTVANDYLANAGGRMLGGIGLTETVLGGSVAAAGPGSILAALGVAGGAGYGIGSLLNKGFEWSDKNLDTNIQGALADTLGKSMAEIASFFGSEDAKRALAAELKIKIDHEGKPQIEAYRAEGFEMDISGGSMLLP